MQMQTFVYAVKNRFYALPEVKICKESETESPHWFNRNLPKLKDKQTGRF